MADELQDAIAKNAAGPKRVQTDGVEVEQHALPDQIAADEYIERKKAGRAGVSRIRPFRINGSPD